MPFMAPAAGAGKGAATAGSAAATKAALISGGLAAAGGVASGIANALLQKDPKDQKIGMPGANPGGVGARPAGQPLFAGRQDFNMQPRQSLAAQLLQRR